MTEAARPLRADARRNRELILLAAEHEFRENGAEAVVEGIARRAGVGIGTIYRNYPTKDALMRAILEARVEPLLLAARAELLRPDARAGFTGFVRRLLADSCDFKALAESLDDAGFDMSAAKEEVGGELFRLIRQLFERARAAGAIREDVTVEDVQVLIMGMSHTAHVSGDQQQVARCVELLCDAICAPVTPGVTLRSGSEALGGYEAPSAGL